MKIVCVGRNYIEHVRELNNVLPEYPVFFIKPDTALLRNNQPFFFPNFTKTIHYEVEIVVKICKVAKCVKEKFADNYYNEIAIGIDFTARDLQAKCKKEGLPWEISKAFDKSAPISDFVNKNEFNDINSLNFGLYKNDSLVQKGNSKNMIFSVNTIISYISQFVTLKIGDYIFTGTPSGVGEIKIGDKLEAFIENKKMLLCNIK